MQTIYWITANNPPTDADRAAATTAGASQILSGIPPRLAGVVSPAALPCAYIETTPDDIPVAPGAVRVSCQVDPANVAAMTTSLVAVGIVTSVDIAGTWIDLDPSTLTTALPVVAQHEVAESTSLCADWVQLLGYYQAAPTDLTSQMCVRLIRSLVEIVLPHLQGAQ